MGLLRTVEINLESFTPSLNPATTISTSPRVLMKHETKGAWRLSLLGLPRNVNVHQSPLFSWLPDDVPKDPTIASALFCLPKLPMTHTKQNQHELGPHTHGLGHNSWL
jgi:hypothetical protein